MQRRYGNTTHVVSEHGEEKERKLRTDFREEENKEKLARIYARYS